MIIKLKIFEGLMNSYYGTKLLNFITIDVDKTCFINENLLQTHIQYKSVVKPTFINSLLE